MKIQWSEPEPKQHHAIVNHLMPGTLVTFTHYGEQWECQVLATGNDGLVKLWNDKRKVVIWREKKTLTIL